MSWSPYLTLIEPLFIQTTLGRISLRIWISELVDCLTRFEYGYKDGGANGLLVKLVDQMVTKILKPSYQHMLCALNLDNMASSSRLMLPARYKSCQEGPTWLIGLESTECILV